MTLPTRGLASYLGLQPDAAYRKLQDLIDRHADLLAYRDTVINVAPTYAEIPLTPGYYKVVATG